MITRPKFVFVLALLLIVGLVVWVRQLPLSVEESTNSGSSDTLETNLSGEGLSSGPKETDVFSDLQGSLDEEVVQDLQKLFALKHEYYTAFQSKDNAVYLELLESLKSFQESDLDDPSRGRCFDLISQVVLFLRENGTLEELNARWFDVQLEGMMAATIDYPVTLASGIKACGDHDRRDLLDRLLARSDEIASVGDCPPFLQRQFVLTIGELGQVKSLPEIASFLNADLDPDVVDTAFYAVSSIEGVESLAVLAQVPIDSQTASGYHLAVQKRAVDLVEAHKRGLIRDTDYIALALTAWSPAIASDIETSLIDLATNSSKEMSSEAVAGLLALLEQKPFVEGMDLLQRTLHELPADAEKRPSLQAKFDRYTKLEVLSPL